MRVPAAAAGALDFGNVPAGSGAVLGFRFENAGGAECAVKDIHLSDDAGGAFFMPGGAITGGSVARTRPSPPRWPSRPAPTGTYHGELEIR